jgi:hypothetical protein
MSRVFYAAATIAVVLSGCSTIQLSHPKKTPAIVHHVQCELKQAYKNLLPDNPWLTSWAAGFTLTMKADNQGSASPEVSLLGPFSAGSFAVAVGGGVSGEGLRTATSKYTIRLDKLDLVDCNQPDEIEGVLGIEEWMAEVLRPYLDNAYRVPDTIGHSVQFSLTYGAHVNPSYVLTRSKGQVGFGAQRIDTDIVDIALTDATPKGAQHVIIDNPREGTRLPGGLSGTLSAPFITRPTSPLVNRGSSRPKNSGASIPDDARQRLDNQLYELQLRNLFGR